MDFIVQNAFREVKESRDKQEEQLEKFQNDIYETRVACDRLEEQVLKLLGTSHINDIVFKHQQNLMKLFNQLIEVKVDMQEIQRWTGDSKRLPLGREHQDKIFGLISDDLEDEKA